MGFKSSKSQEYQNKKDLLARDANAKKRIVKLINADVFYKGSNAMRNADVYKKFMIKHFISNRSYSFWSKKKF